MHRKLILSLVASVVVATALLGTTLAFGWHPALGLDLRGGISVTLRPVPGEEYDSTSLSLAVERIRERVDSFGVGEPEIVRQDDAIVVNLPGVNDQEKALELVNVTGKVYLRPVLACGPVTPPAEGTDTSTTTAPTTVDGSAPGTSTTVAGTAPADSGDATTPPTEVASPNTDPADTASSRAFGRVTPTTEADPTDSSDQAATSTSTSTSTTLVDASSTTTSATTTVDSSAETSPSIAFSDPLEQQVLTNRENTEVCQVGPSGGDGTVFVKDSAEGRIIGGDWGVTVDLKDGSGGEGLWNSLAASCFSRSETCPSGRLAIELDGVIQSAPNVNDDNFGNSVQISGSFTAGEARKLAQVLNSGALPITLQNEAIENVSATLGEDSLKAALVSGGIGIGLVLLFMMLYYRRLAVVVVAGLLVSGALIYSASAMISEFYNGVLSLSGIAGLIVSIGVTVDTYVVFFERLKDDVRIGRSLKNSARRGFKSAFRTVLVANTVSLIGALVLFYLSVGAVRGFAFYLALSTVADVIVAYFFTGPAVLLLARSRFMQGAKIMGLDV